MVLKKRHRFIEQSFRLCGRRRGRDVSMNSIETCILSRVKQITGPGWMHETSARTWCSGRTWRERVGREVGGGIGMGKTCEPKAFSFQCMTKFTTNKKIIIKKKEYWSECHSLLQGIFLTLGSNLGLPNNLYHVSPNRETSSSLGRD